MSYEVADILVTETSGSGTTWVSFPYAAGAPEVMRGLGGTWDKVASAWSVPNDRMSDTRRAFRRIGALVHVQLAIDGKSHPDRPPVAHQTRSAAPRVRVSVVGDDWVSIGPLGTHEEREAARRLGCAPKGVEWFAPDAISAGECLDVTERVRADTEERKIRAAEAKEAADLMAAEARESARIKAILAQADYDALYAVVGPVLGKWRFPADNMQALVEVANAWLTARFVSISSRLLDDRGSEPSVVIRTPQGRRVSVADYMGQTRKQLSRRVSLVTVQAPVFPEGSGFTVSVSTYKNGNTSEWDFEPYVVVSQSEPSPEPVVITLDGSLAELVRAAAESRGLTDQEAVKAALQALALIP